MTNNTDNSSWAYGILTAADVDQLESWYMAYEATMRPWRAEVRARIRAKQDRRDAK